MIKAAVLIQLIQEIKKKYFGFIIPPDIVHRSSFICCHNLVGEQKKRAKFEIKNIFVVQLRIQKEFVRLGNKILKPSKDCCYQKYF